MRQFDTLGFVGTYVLDKAASGPDRYVFARKLDDEYHEMLELDPDGKAFQP